MANQYGMDVNSREKLPQPQKSLDRAVLGYYSMGFQGPPLGNLGLNGSYLSRIIAGLDER
jgi:hypothetical protein